MTRPGMSDGRAFGLGPYVTESTVIEESKRLKHHPDQIVVYERARRPDRTALESIPVRKA